MSKLHIHLHRATKDALSSAQVEQLRAEYGKIERVDPDSPTYKKLTALLDKLDQKGLKELANANIKWVSSLARNRVRTPSLNKYPEFKDAVKFGNERKYSSYSSWSNAVKSIGATEKKVANGFVAMFTGVSTPIGDWDNEADIGYLSKPEK